MILPSLPHTPASRGFERQDLLEPDWDVRPAAAAAGATATVSSCALRGSSVSHGEPEKSCPQQAGGSSASPCNGTVRSSLQGSALALRRLPSTRPAPQNNSPLNAAASPQSGGSATTELLKLRGAQEDFDDWDVDLADLDECPVWKPLQSPAPPAPEASPTASAKKLRPPSHGGFHFQPKQSVSELSPARQASSANQLPPQTAPTPLHSYSRPVVHSAPRLGPNLCPAPSPINRTQQQHRPCTTPGPFPHPPGLFDNPSPAPSRASTILSPHPLHTPVLTNRLVQLVSASSKRSSKRLRTGCDQPRTRRFPGPAGLLPEQVSVASPQTACGLCSHYAAAARVNNRHAGYSSPCFSAGAV